MNDIVRCSRCNKTLIAESFKEHDCSPIFRDTKTILIDWFTTTKDEQGRITILANCMDGILLSLVVSNKNAIPIPFVPPKNQHPDKTPRDSTKDKVSIYFYRMQSHLRHSDQ